MSGKMHSELTYKGVDLRCSALKIDGGFQGAVFIGTGFLFTPMPDTRSKPHATREDALRAAELLGKAAIDRELHRAMANDSGVATGSARKIPTSAIGRES